MSKKPVQTDLETYIDHIDKRDGTIERHTASAQDVYLDERGREVPDPTPIAPPVGWNPQPTLVEMIRNMVKSEKLAQEAAAAGAETFEEADDFEVGDDYDPESPYENDFDPPVKDIVKAVEESKKKSEGVSGESPDAKPKAPEEPPAPSAPPAKPA